MALAQDKSDSLNISSGESFLYERKFLLTPKIDSLSKGGFLVDSTVLFLPKKLYSERNLDFSPSPKVRVGIPTYKLPDPQSRMPIKEFDDSVNYTLQIKKYDKDF